jgi:hypothetical protein
MGNKGIDHLFGSRITYGTFIFFGQYIGKVSKIDRVESLLENKIL